MADRAPRKLLVLTGDHSADGHAAAFIRTLRESGPDGWQIAGVGGVAMQAEPGIEILSDHRDMNVIGIGGVLRAIPSHRRLAQKILAWCDAHKPDVAVLIDYGVFHLHLAPQLRARGIKVLYFIPPQIWASRPWRLKKLRAAADEVLVILPFEEEYYRSRGIPATFVGNPLAARLPPPTTKPDLAARYGLDASRTLIGLFPGSRKLEINYLLTNQIAAAKLLNERYPGRFEFALSKAKNLKDEFFRQRLDAAGGTGLPWLKIVDDNYALLSASDLILAASGTLTLEAALYRTPMVVMYRGPWYAYQLAKRLITVPNIALPNTLTRAGRRIVPELWQYDVNPEQVAATALEMLEPARHAQARQELGDVATMFQDGRTPQRVADAVRRLAEAGDREGAKAAKDGREE